MNFKAAFYSYPRWLVVSLCFLLGDAGLLHADPPVPANVLNPPTVAEAWNVLRLASDNVGTLLKEKRLAEIPVQVSLCSPALRTLERFLLNGAETSVLREQTAAVTRKVIQIAEAANGQNQSLAEVAYEELKSVVAAMGSRYDTGVVNGDIYVCPVHSEFVSTTAAVPCDRCGMRLMVRRIPYSFIYRPPGEPSLSLTASMVEPMERGREARVRIKLATRDGKPVTPSELVTVHTQPIHLHIVDASLGDYHHEHPAQLDRQGQPIPPTPVIEGALCGPLPTLPGEYEFKFTPAKAGAYRIFAEVVPTATGIQEYVSTDLPGQGMAGKLASKADALTATAGGLQFKLGINGLVQARKTRYVQVTIKEADGTPMRRLEPVMNAFAHLVGFYGDGRTVLHMHPEGGDILRSEARGGPALGFKIYAPQAGFVRLYCQVQVEGRMIFAPFNLNVAE